MRAEEIWKASTGTGIKVAVIDTGVSASTASLKGQVLDGFDATKVKGEATDAFDGHGTTMAELIAGTGAGGGLKGLAPGARIIPIRISENDVQGGEQVNNFDTVDAIRAAADSDAQIISMSFANDVRSVQEHDAVKYAQSKGKLFFAGVGNNAKKGNKKQYPAAYPEVVGVAGIDQDGRVGDYSQHGDVVDLAAPGSEIPGWCDNTFKRYCDADGTSNATALASASAALIWSAHPDWTSNQVLRVMIESAGRAKGTKAGAVSEYLGHGIIRPNTHLTHGVGKPGDPNINPLTNEKTLDTKSSPTPAASSSNGSQAKSDDKVAVAGSSEEAGGSGKTGWLIGGGAAVIALAAVGGFVAVRRKRTT
ncbi:S8 family serine peptidase [Streptomyces sp. NPDC050418]|uniref:S8 family serine peptidase n=1 Tax=Streptomyces sp. NPDC050418 TaxID=3365612 RepID=UPI00379E4ED4